MDPQQTRLIVVFPLRYTSTTHVVLMINMSVDLPGLLLLETIISSDMYYFISGQSCFWVDSSILSDIDPIHDIEVWGEPVLIKRII